MESTQEAIDSKGDTTEGNQTFSVTNNTTTAEASTKPKRLSYNTNSKMQKFGEYIHKKFPHLSEQRIRYARLAFHKINRAFITDPRINKRAFFNYNYLAHKFCKLYKYGSTDNLEPVPDHVWLRNEDLWDRLNVKIE